MNDSSSPAPATTKRRPVLAISGWVLLVCLFLPTIKVCGSPTAPVSFPPCYGVYVGGALVALIAGSRTLRSRRIILPILVALDYVGVGAFITLAIGALAEPAAWCAGVALLAGGVLVVRAVVRAKLQAAGITVFCIVHAALAALWCGLLALDGTAMWGAYVAIAAVGVMVLSALLALADEQRGPSRAEALPVARIL